MSAIKELLEVRQQLIVALDRVCALISDYESPPQHIRIYDYALDARRVCTQEDVDLMSDALRKRLMGERVS